MPYSLDQRNYFLFAFQFFTGLNNLKVLLFSQELIKDQVANMYLWPRTLEVPIMDPTKYVVFYIHASFFALRGILCPYIFISLQIVQLLQFSLC